MWRILLNPYVLIVLVIAALLGYNAYKYSRLRRRMTQIPPRQKVSLLLLVLRFLSLLFRRF
jgi:hypothetical protein